MPGPNTEVGLRATLPPFLRRAAGRTYQLGAFDCGLLLADWCIEMGLDDPAPDLRGGYDTIDAALALGERKTLPRLFDDRFRSVGMVRTRTPNYGDICMLNINGSPRGAIITSGYVTVAQRAGICRVPFGVRRIMAWTAHG